MVQMTLAKRHVYLCSGAHFLIHTCYFQMKPIRQSLLCINPIYPAFGVCVPNMIFFSTLTTDNKGKSKLVELNSKKFLNIK